MASPPHHQQEGGQGTGAQEGVQGTGEDGRGKGGGGQEGRRRGGEGRVSLAGSEISPDTGATPEVPLPADSTEPEEVPLCFTKDEVIQPATVGLECTCAVLLARPGFSSYLRLQWQLSLSGCKLRE